MKILVTNYLLMFGICFRGVFFIPSGGWLLLFVEFLIFYSFGDYGLLMQCIKNILHDFCFCFLNFMNAIFAR